MWDELDNLRPMPRCKCAIQCSCRALSPVQDQREQDYVIRFLKGLNEQYAHVRSQIMMINPLPDIGKAFSMALQQERQMNSPLPANDTMALAANSINFGNGPRGRFQNNNGRGRGRNNNNGGRGQGGNKYFTQCKMTDHTVDTCYFKHGFPTGYQSKGKSQANSVSNEQDSKAASSSITQELFQSLIDLLHQSKLTAQPQPTLHSTNSMISTPIALTSSPTSMFGKHQHL